MNQVEKHLKAYLSRFVFVTLKKGFKTKNKEIDFLAGIPLPIGLDDMTAMVKEKDVAEEISLNKVVKGIIHVLGCDSDFVHADVYKKFLKTIDLKIVDYIGYEGVKLADEKKYLDAAIYFKALLFLDPDNINGRFNYARCCQDISLMTEVDDEKKDFNQEAFQVFEKITIDFPEFAPAYYNLGFYYTNRKLFKKAELIWKKFLHLSDNGDQKEEIQIQLEQLKDSIQYEEGYNLILKGESEDGLAKLLPLLPIYPEWWNMIFFVGLAYRKLGNVEEALKYFKKAMQIKPSKIDIINEIALCYAALLDYDHAAKYFKKAILVGGENEELLCNLGMVYMEQKKYIEAREMFEKSRALNPEDAIVMDCLKILENLEREEMI